ncbi:MAG: cytochrome c [Paracoccaceae bacterium]
MIKPYILVVSTVLMGSAVLAHSGVKNPAVQARMHAMSIIGEDVKTLGLMAKGEQAFDVDAAKAALREIAEHAGQAPDLFRANEDDPKSEAKPAIWENFEDFTTKAVALENVALELSTSLASVDDLGPAMAALGDTCKSCHSDYRE